MEEEGGKTTPEKNRESIRYYGRNRVNNNNKKMSDG